MNLIFNRIFSVRVMVWISILSVITFVASTYNRYIYVDDAWFGEQAYWFAKEHIVRANSIKDFFGWDQQLLVYHKLHIILGAGLISVFGWSVTPLRLITLFVVIVFLFVFYSYFKNRNDVFKGNEAFIAIFLFIIHPLIALYAFTFRPEIIVMTFGFLSWLMLDNYLSKEKGIKPILFAGIFAGLAFLTHINGMVFGMAGAIVLLWFKKFKPLFVFSVITALVASFYFFDLLAPGKMELFFYQISNWPDAHGSNYLNPGIGE